MMAKVIQENQRRVVVEPWWASGISVYIGLGLGLLWWVLASLLRRYVIEPIACQDVVSVAACTGSMGVAGSIATVLVAVAGLLLLVRYAQPRPVISALAAAILLWDLGILVEGLSWWAALLWVFFFYAAAYGLFSMVARIRTLWFSVIVALVIAVGARILLTL